MMRKVDAWKRARTLIPAALLLTLSLGLSGCWYLDEHGKLQITDEGSLLGLTAHSNCCRQ
jgi:hypothetical protein